MSRDTEILDTIDAVAGHQRTGNGKETVGSLTAELRDYFQTPDDIAEVTGAILEQEPVGDITTGEPGRDGSMFNDEMDRILREEEDNAAQNDDA